MALFQDPFNGTNGTTVGSTTGWSLTPGFYDVLKLDGAGAVKSDSYTDDPKSIINDTGALDHYCEAVVGAGFVGTAAFGKVNLGASQTGRTAKFNVSYNGSTGQLRIMGRRDGTDQTVTTVTTALAAGDTLRIEQDDTAKSLVVKINGTSVFTTSDTTFFNETPSTGVGLILDFNGNSALTDIIRNFESNTLGGGDTTNPDFGAATLGFVTKTDTTVSLATSAAATDNVAVTGYEWSSDNGATYPFTSLSNSFTFTALTALTSYNFRVRAYDAAGNRSTALTLTTSTYRAGDTGQNIVDDTAAIPGVQEEGFLYNDVVLPADAAKWFSYNITTPVTDTGSLTLYPNGSFIWVGLSADSFYYQLEVDGANVGSPQLVSLDPADGSQDLTFTLFTNTNTFEPFTVANEAATNLTFTTFTNTQTFYPFTVYRAGDPLPVTSGKQQRLSMKMGLGL